MTDFQMTIPLKLSAQLVGTYSLQLELAYDAEENGEMKGTTRILNLEVIAKEPFLVTTTVLNMNGTPMSSILNHCEHILNVNIHSTAAIVISSVAFLLADVVTQCDASRRKSSESAGDSRIQVQDVVEEGEEVCYSTAIRVLVNEDETEIPLGRMCVEWKRYVSIKIEKNFFFDFQKIFLRVKKLGSLQNTMEFHRKI